MIPVTQFILGNSDPLLYPSEKMTNSIDEQIAFLQSQKQAINEAYRRNAIPNAITNHYCKTVKGNYLRIVPFLFI
nr:MAG: hypothetical protein [Bacteriophage sp.]